MRGYFIYNNMNSREFGVLIDKYGTYRSAERDYDTISVEGRNGDLTIDNGRYKNVDIVYQCGIGVDFRQNMPGFSAWLMKNLDYHRLEDSYQPEVFRMARVKGAPDPEVFQAARGGTFNITFDCKPQRWLKSGEKEIILQTSNQIYNPTLYHSYPIFEITGNGNLVIGSKTITIANNPGTLILDCELGDAYSKDAHTNYNRYVTETDLELTTLSPGVNNITKPAGMTVKMKPRWWTL